MPTRAGVGNGAASKITGAHLERSAFIYVRQSTLRQVMSNTESTARQYALKQRAITLGWQPEQVVTIDSDQGHSGASAADREGFQRLVAEVGLGRAGIVLGLEVSRLARNSADWHRLVELCALANTAIADEDGVYDPSDFNDQLLLGLKGTMSAAELHFLRARLIGGQLSKARRGELKVSLPVGLVYDPLDRVQLDPDKAVHNAVRLLFDTFAQQASGRAVVQAFAQQHLTFPIRHRSGPHKGELGWLPLTHSRVLQVLHNPATPAPSATAATAPATNPPAARASNSSPATNGSPSSPTRTPASSPGRPSSTTRAPSRATPPPTPKTATPARHAKATPSCKASPSAATAATA